MDGFEIKECEYSMGDFNMNMVGVNGKLTEIIPL